MNVRELKRNYPFHMLAVALTIGVILYTIAKSLL